MTSVTNGTANRKSRNVRPVTGTAKWVLAMSAAGFGVIEITTATGTKRYSVTTLPNGGYRMLSEQGQVYDIDAAAEHWTCDCPDYLHSRANRDPNGCRHVAGLRAALAKIGRLPGQPAPTPEQRSLGDRMRNDPPAVADDGWRDEPVDVEDLLRPDEPAPHFAAVGA